MAACQSGQPTILKFSHSTLTLVHHERRQNSRYDLVGQEKISRVSLQNPNWLAMHVLLRYFHTFKGKDEKTLNYGFAKYSSRLSINENTSDAQIR